MSSTEDLSRLVQQVRGWLRVASRDALAGGAHVADEGDRWFVAAARELGKGAHRAEQGADIAVEALVAQLARLRPRWMRQRTPRERIEHLLHVEAKRLDFDISQEQFRAFSEKIAILLELVYTGAVRLDDIVFENAKEDAPVAADPTPAATPQPLAEPSEEMPEHQQPDEGGEGEAVHEQKDPAV